MATPDVHQDTLIESPDAAREWRAAQYEEMGFARSEANALAKALQKEVTGGKLDERGNEISPKLEWTIPLSWKKVKAALDAGCDHATALEIFL